MQIKLNYDRIRNLSSDFDSTATFNIVMAYEDFSCGYRALSVYDQLARQLDSEWLFNQNMWKFDVLERPKLRAMAANDAAEADIVIVAAHAQTELIPAVRSWVQMWLSRRKGNPGAMVVLLEAEDELPAPDYPIVSYLRSLAEKAPMDFFFHVFSLEAEEPNFSAEAILGRLGRKYPTLAVQFDSRENFFKVGIHEDEQLALR